MRKYKIWEEACGKAYGGEAVINKYEINIKITKNIYKIKS